MQQQILREWIASDPLRMRALRIARDLALPDWCIAAGFVRNLAWDKLHRFEIPTPLTDIDLIYFDPERASKEHEREIEARLAAIDTELPWSVRNQARMHTRNGDQPYKSTMDAMRYWVELETAIGARLDADGRIEIISPFGLDSLFAKKITPNQKHYKPAEFSRRLSKKNWLWIWPELKVDV
ncbi:nucleotidyltransferase family protein [Noviherbaspirillum sp.]|uniref:nucleotidyltransferase family protein n=1 Tax=Noviherbaspirillum sp. TaxID=1926288 RepID=UPI002B48D562|nr:nucleotidyltransferase family protein [Noviherbaspirillum sp.]HJV82224.1 nucleotidyltransferase family protein [Noviherbaspirillum sp.]